MLVAAGNGRDRVDGSLRPGNEVRRTLSVVEAMTGCREDESIIVKRLAGF